MIKLKILTLEDQKNILKNTYFKSSEFQMVWKQVPRSDTENKTFFVIWNIWGYHVLNCPRWKDILISCPSIKVKPGKYGQNITISNKDLVFIKLLLD